MAKQRRHRRSGRGSPNRRHPRSHGRAPVETGLGGPAEPDLLRDIRRAIAEDHPQGILALTSSLLAVVDPRGVGPFERARGQDAAQLGRDELLRSFLEVKLPETSALLTVIAVMTSDEVERARIRRELETRQDAIPPWLAALDEAQAYRAVEMTHVLGDGDSVVLGARFATGDEVSIVVYIDHNLGSVAKDAFVVPKPIGELISFMRSKAVDPDTEWRDLALADARARVTAAVDAGAITFPPFETDTWPACRPLVEWIARQLPAGGRGYERPEWPDDARQRLADRFFASPFAAGLDDADHQDLLDTLLWFGCDYGPGDPLRWSPVAVEILLIDWVPRKIMAGAGFLAKAPDLLRAFARFCHHERGIRPALTAETLAAVDRWEPDYQRAIRTPRPQGPAALLAAVGALDPGGPWPMPDEEPQDYRDVMLDVLRRAVGGPDRLADLDDAPLPDEPFAWSGIPDDIRDRVGDVLARCDRCCDELLDVEYRTACRRLLARAAAGDPDVFRRRARTDTAAAAVCWIIGKANELFAASGERLLVKDLMAHFGLAHSGISQRAATLLRAAGFEQDTYGEVRLGSPAFLVSSRRRRIIQRRDLYQAEAE